MSLHVILALVAKQLEKLQRDFLWGSVEGVKKYHLVSWEAICQPRFGGSLGMRRLGTFNKALLGKWIWRFTKEIDRLWRRVIVAKYGAGWSNWWPGRVGRSHGRALWKGIMLGFTVMGVGLCGSGSLFFC